MADLEIKSQSVLPIDFDYPQVAYEKDDGDRTAYLLSSNQTVLYEVSLNLLSIEKYEIVYNLWKQKKTNTSFTWLDNTGTEKTVIFDSKPKFSIENNARSCSFTLRVVS